MRIMVLFFLLALLPAGAADLYGRIDPGTGQWSVTNTVQPDGAGWLPYVQTPQRPFDPLRFKMVEYIPPPLVGDHYLQYWVRKALTAEEQEIAKLRLAALAVLAKLDRGEELTSGDIAVALRFLLKRGL